MDYIGSQLHKATIAGTLAVLLSRTVPLTAKSEHINATG